MLTHLVEASALAMLGLPEARSTIEAMTVAGRLGRTGISDLSVGSMTRDREEFDRLIRGLSVFELVETTEQHFRRALQVQRLIAPFGAGPPAVPRLLVAAVAELSELTLLHHDRFFDHVQELTGQPCQWIVPRDVTAPTRSARQSTRRRRPSGAAPIRRARPARLASASRQAAGGASEEQVSEEQTAKMTRAEVFELVRTQLADILEISPDKITESSSLSEDLDADSLALIELVESLEEELRNQVAGFRIDDEDLEDLRTVRDAVDYVSAKLEAA